MRDRILELGPPIRRGILLGLAAGVPLFFLRMVNGIFGASKLGLLMMGVSVVAAIRGIELLQGASFAGLTRLAIPSLALGVPLSIAWVASPYRYWSLFGWYPRFLGLVPYLVVILYGILVADAFAGRTRQLVWAMAIAGTVVGVYGLVQMIGADPFEWRAAGAGSSVANSTLGNSNFAGAFVGMTFPFFVALWVEQPDQRRRLMWMFLLAVAGWVVSLSEAAYVAGAAGVVVVIAWVASSRWGRARLVGLVAAAGALAVPVAAVVYRAVDPVVGDTITYRGWWWRAAGEMAGSSPLVGRGPATFAVEGVRHRVLDDALTFGYGFPDDPHAVVMALVASAGILGVLGFLAILAWAVRAGLSIPKSQVLPAAFFASVVAYFVNSMTTIDEISLRVALWTALGGLAATLVQVGSADVKPSRPRNRKRIKSSSKAAARSRRPPRVGRPMRAWPAVVAAGIAGLVGFLWSVGFLVADARVRQGQTLFVQGRVDEGRKELDRAIAFRGDYAYRTLYGLLLGAEAVARGQDGAPLVEDMSSAFSYIDHFPYVPAHGDYALKLHEWGQVDAAAYERALAIFERARRFDPLNPVLRAQTADTLMALGRHDDAIALLVEFTDEAGDRSADLWGALALAYFRAGDADAAKEAMTTALAIDAGEKRALEVQELLDKGSE